MAELNIGVVGATGMVGEAFMEILTSHKFPLKTLRPFASDKSAGSKVKSCGREWTVETLTPGCFKGLDLVFFSSGDDISKEWGPRAVEEGAFAVDNSAAFRASPEHLLVVPEVNGHLLPKAGKDKPSLIANPNCSTIQLVVALEALKKFEIKDVRVASYQAVSGAGKVGPEELIAQTTAHVNGQQEPEPKTFAHPIAFNVVPHIGGFNDKGFSSEEMKIMTETRKIMGMANLPVSAFTVRVPSLNSHSEAVWVTFGKTPAREEVVSALRSGKGLEYIEHKNPGDYPTARTASGQEPVYVGRLHQDLYNPQTWLMWVVADNILKGAALNGLQIAEQIFDL
jgi:aspartate-semialdehyde dehydrogenase